MPAIWDEDPHLEEDARKGALKLKALLAQPGAFEKWANDALDMSRMRGRRRAKRLQKRSAK